MRHAEVGDDTGRVGWKKQLSEDCPVLAIGPEALINICNKLFFFKIMHMQQTKSRKGHLELDVAYHMIKNNWTRPTCRTTVIDTRGA
jgi:hypothetical protein